MKLFAFVWGFTAFTILGLEFLPKTETFDALQDFESNFKIVNHPEDFLPNWSANEVRDKTARVFQATGEGTDGSKALGIQTTGSFNSEIYTKTTTKEFTSNIVSLKLKTKRNGSGNRPVSVFYSFSIDDGFYFTSKQQLGDQQTFKNEDSGYEQYEFTIPEDLLEKDWVMIKIEVVYGEGNGSAARLFMDDFTLHGLLKTIQPPLEVVSVEQKEGNQLTVHFNQSIGLADSTNPQILLDQSYGKPTKVTVDDQLIHLEFEDYLYSNHYNLSFKDLASLSTNEIREDLSYAFDLISPTPVGTIVINEFMADPNPKGLVPGNPILPGEASQEYIELFNTTEKPLWLKGFTYNGGSLEDFILRAGDFVLISSTPTKEKLLPFGESIAATPFRPLPNTMGHISINDAFGNVTDSLSYSSAWYDQPQKKSGGWSLERVNPYLACSDSDNWKASQSSSGGTPAKPNSVLDLSADERPFTITQLRATSNRAITVTFSKSIRAENIQEAVFTLEGKKLSITSISLKTIHLSIPFEMISENSYELEVSSLLDCAGTPLLTPSQSFFYDGEGPYIERVASLAPDELMVHFNEPVNASSAKKLRNYQINQKEDQVKSVVIKDSATVQLILNDELTLNRHHTLLTHALEDLYGNSSREIQFEFFLDNQLDTVLWVGPNLLDLYFFTELEHSSVSEDNFSANKNIGAPRRAYSNPEQQKLVHLVFEKNLPQNTPVTITSHDLKNSSGEYINTHKKTVLYDNRSIAVDNMYVVNDSTIALVFNKSLHPEFSSIEKNYSINHGIGNPYSANQVSADSVILTVNKLSEDQNYILSISGLQDVFGIAMKRIIKRDFVFDLSGPAILEALLTSPFTIKLKANEAFLPPSKDQITINHREVAHIEMLAENECLITSVGELTEHSVQVMVRDLTDFHENTSEPILLDILNNKIILADIFLLNEDSIQLTFTAKVDPASTDHIKINGDAPMKTILKENQFELILSLHSSLLLMDSVAVEVSSIQSQKGKGSQKTFKKLLYDDQIKDLFVANPRVIQILHATSLDKFSAEKELYYLRDQSHQLQPRVDPSDQRVLQLTSNQPLLPDITYELKLPFRRSVQQGPIPGSTRKIVYDKSPPELIGVETLNEKEILVSFDEALDPILSLVTSFYNLNGNEPEEVIAGELPHQVILVSSHLLETEKANTLTVTRLEDLYRNALTEAQLEFFFDGPVSPSFKDIIINEIMAAPRSGQELPDVEYIELFNTSQKEIYLGGLSLSNSRSSTILPRKSVSSGEFIILAPASRIEELEKFGPTLGLSHWPTLLNNGDVVRLVDQTGNLVDEIEYSTANYGSPDKAQGGFSLELVNPFAVCSDISNLKPSESILKGTPGQVNSVFDATPDTILPEVLKATLLGEGKVALDFSKALHHNLDPIQINILPAISIETLAIDESNPKRLILTITEPLEQNVRYQISIQKLRDCSGNLIDPKGNTTTLILPVPAQAGEVLLNEVLFNPKNGSPKFVEVYNQSAHFIDLQGWKLANLNHEEAASRKVISSEPLIIAPFSFLVFTTDASGLKQAYPQGVNEAFIEMSALPSYPMGRGTVIFLDPEEKIIERLDYDEKFHHSLLDEVRGISLERLSLAHEVNDPKNWHSASAASGHATPGYKNSHSRDENFLNEGIVTSPQVFVPDAPGEESFTTISYKMDRPGIVATLRIYNVAGQLIRELCQNDIWGSSGFYTWDGTDFSGRKVRPGYYIVWVETLSLEGRIEHIRKTVVVGSKF